MSKDLRDATDADVNKFEIKYTHFDKDGKLQQGLSQEACYQLRPQKEAGMKTKANYSHVIHTSCEGCVNAPIHSGALAIDFDCLCYGCYDHLRPCSERKNYTPVPPVTYTSCPSCAKLQSQRGNLRALLTTIQREDKGHGCNVWDKEIQKVLDEN